MRRNDDMCLRLSTKSYGLVGIFLFFNILHVFIRKDELDYR